MKIHRKGKKPEDKEATTECTDCECKFTFKQSEARFRGDQRDGDAFIVNCPECKHPNWVAADLFH